MNTETFSKFKDHFDKFEGTECPMELVLDSVSTHVNQEVFIKALDKGTEMYRIDPGATYFMQPLDKGVLGYLNESGTSLQGRLLVIIQEKPFGQCISLKN